MIFLCSVNYLGNSFWFGICIFRTNICIYYGLRQNKHTHERNRMWKKRRERSARAKEWMSESEKKYVHKHNNCEQPIMHYLHKNLYETKFETKMKKPTKVWSWQNAMYVCKRVETRQDKAKKITLCTERNIYYTIHFHTKCQLSYTHTNPFIHT